MTDEEIADYFADTPGGPPIITKRPNAIFLRFPETLRADGTCIHVVASIDKGSEVSEEFLSAMRRAAVEAMQEAAQ